MRVSPNGTHGAPACRASVAVYGWNTPAYSMHKDMANVPSGHLVRATTDDREHQLWVAATASEKNKLKPEELEILNLRPGEVREITNSSDPIPQAPVISSLTFASAL